MAFLSVVGACGVEALDRAEQAVLTPPPHAAFSVVCVGTTCTADAEAASAEAGFLTTFAWQWGDGATTTGGSPVQETSHTFGSLGTFTITLTVTDSFGGTSSTTRTINLAAGPTASFDPKCGQLFCIGDAVLTSGPAAIINYHWDWDDETTTDSSDNVVTHQYAYGATFRIHLSVTDANGREAGVTKSVTLPVTF